MPLSFQVITKKSSRMWFPIHSVNIKGSNCFLALILHIEKHYIKSIIDVLVKHLKLCSTSIKTLLVSQCYDGDFNHISFCQHCLIQCMGWMVLLQWAIFCSFSFFQWVGLHALFTAHYSNSALKIEMLSWTEAWRDSSQRYPLVLGSKCGMLSTWLFRIHSCR